MADVLFCWEKLAELLDKSKAGPWRHPGCYRGAQVEIDLTSAQGRWELLALAVLLAARISEFIAEKTFLGLKNSGLLDLERLAAARPADGERMLAIMCAEYRAVVDRRRKTEALMANAGRVWTKHGGDLHNIYTGLFCREDPVYSSGQILAELRAFRGLDIWARWFCRGMYEADIWPVLDVSVRAFVDAHVRRALLRLGFITPAAKWPELPKQVETLIRLQFAGDPTGLYKLGRYFCQATGAACPAACPLEEFCAWRRVL